MLSRRTFLSLTAGLPMLGSKLCAALPVRRSPSCRDLVIAPETGLLESTAGCDVDQQMVYAASLGFRGFSSSHLLDAPEPESQKCLAAAEKLQLRLAPPRLVISSACDSVSELIDNCLEHQLQRVATWGLDGLRLELGGAFHARFSIDTRYRSEWLALFQRGADFASERNMSLIVEPWDHPARFSTCQLSWLDRLHTAAHPGWKMSVDTYRWGLAGMDLEILAGELAAVVGHVELADFPGGGAPGTGQLPLSHFLTSLSLHGYAGVLALRHGSGGGGRANDQYVVRACASLLSEVAELTGSSEFPRTA